MLRPRTLARIPVFRRLAELSTFLFEGATVETRHGGALAMRTIIQLDGDVLTLATAAASEAAVRERHALCLEVRLRALARRLKGPADMVTWLVGSVCFAVATGWSFPWESDMDGWREHGWTWSAVYVGVSAVIGFSGRIGFVRRILWKALVRVVRSRS